MPNRNPGPDTIEDGENGRSARRHRTVEFQSDIAEYVKHRIRPIFRFSGALPWFVGRHLRELGAWLQHSEAATTSVWLGG